MPPGMAFRGSKNFCYTWVPIAITYIMNFWIHAPLGPPELILSNIYIVIGSAFIKCNSKTPAAPSV